MERHNLDLLYYLNSTSIGPRGRGSTIAGLTADATMNPMLDYSIAIAGGAPII